MASRRVARSAVDWAAFAERVPQNQRDVFRNFKAKSEKFVNKVHQNPENLPKIDFSFYKSKLTNPGLAEEFEKQYGNVSVPYPKDGHNMMKTISAQQTKAETASKVFVNELQVQIKEATAVLSKIDSIPPPDQMTMEMYAHYFPSQALNPVKRPTFWPHVPMLQPGDPDCEYITK